jgi:hypothetical protein
MYKTLHYIKKKKEGATPIFLVVRWDPGAGCGTPQCPPPLALLPEQRPPLLERGQPELESVNGRVVAPVAGKDVLRRCPGNHSPFGLQVVEDGELHVSQSLDGGIQHREDSAK